MSDEEGQGSGRRFRRTDLPSQVEIEVSEEAAEHSGATTTGEMVNVGLGGILARIDQELAEGTLCVVRFLDKEMESGTVEARVHMFQKGN